MKAHEVFFATDQGYVTHLGVAIKSLLESNKNDSFKIQVINGGILKEDWDKLEIIIKEYPNTELINCFFDDSLLAGIKINYHFNKSNYYRLFIPNFTSEAVVLYIDADVVVKDAISELFDLNISSYFIAAVENPGFKNHSKLLMNKNSKYFNSGVMLINVNKWKEHGLTSKVIDFVYKNPENVEFVDQCGLNSVINGNWLELSADYNLQAAFFEKKYMDLVIADLCVDDSLLAPKIIHYTGSKKPWHFCNKHPFRKDYWKYRYMTPYRSFFADDFNFFKLISCYTPNIVKYFIKGVVR
jgi:lipopolysaccharide biosynthesis glycosyltransferase